MFKKALFATLLGTLACSVQAAHTDQDPIPLMVVQSVDMGQSANRVEEIFGQNVGEKVGKSRTYHLNILNTATSKTTSCEVKAKFNKNKETSVFELDQLKWKSLECQDLLAESGYAQYAESERYKPGNTKATVFFGYKESKYDEKLNKTDLKMLVNDLKDRGIEQVNVISYHDEALDAGHSLAFDRATNVKQLLQSQGFEGGVIYHEEKVLKRQAECLKDVDCLIKPWIISIEFSE